jgi:hypothetical protein
MKELLSSQWRKADAPYQNLISSRRSASLFRMSLRRLRRFSVFVMEKATNPEKLASHYNDGSEIAELEVSPLNTARATADERRPSRRAEGESRVRVLAMYGS